MCGSMKNVFVFREFDLLIEQMGHTDPCTCLDKLSRLSHLLSNTAGCKFCGLESVSFNTEAKGLHNDLLAETSTLSDGELGYEKTEARDLENEDLNKMRLDGSIQTSTYCCEPVTNLDTTHGFSGSVLSTSQSSGGRYLVNSNKLKSENGTTGDELNCLISAIDVNGCRSGITPNTCNIDKIKPDRCACNTTGSLLLGGKANCLCFAMPPDKTPELADCSIIKRLNSVLCIDKATNCAEDKHKSCVDSTLNTFKSLLVSNCKSVYCQIRYNEEMQQALKKYFEYYDGEAIKTRHIRPLLNILYGRKGCKSFRKDLNDLVQQKVQCNEMFDCIKGYFSLQ